MRAITVKRETVMFATALFLTVYETVWGPGDRPYLITLYAMMMGLASMLRTIRIGS